MRPQNKCEIHNFFLTGEETGKNVAGIANVLEKDQLQGKKLFFIELVHWTSDVQILVVREYNSLVQKKLFK